MSDLTDRLRGQYSVGPQGEFGTRSFSHFIPPICIEAAERIEALEKELNELLKDQERLDWLRTSDCWFDDPTDGNWTPESWREEIDRLRGL